MPYYYNRYRYPRGFGRYIRSYGRRYSSAGKIRTSRNVRASAQNMTQGGKFTVTAHETVTLTIPRNSGGQGQTKNIATLILTSSMHRNLSNVFDQYRIEKAAIKLKDAGVTLGGGYETNQLPVLSSIVDRTGLAAGIDLNAMRTYSSYKETSLSANNDISPTHTIYIGASNIVEATTYYDTKQISNFPQIYIAISLPTNVPNVEDYSYTRTFTMDIEAQVRYRGVRLDTRGVYI